MASIAGATLIWRGSFLDRLWTLNARAYKQLAPFGSAAGVAFLLLGAALAFAGTGWFWRRFWGWSLAVIIIATQVVGNLANALLGDLLRGGVGLIFSLALLFFLLRSPIRAAFAKQLSGGLR
ncbi:MAG TPA: hypothetical protein VJA94_02280 [Candidatus Angelobacter sp.]